MIECKQNRGQKLVILKACPGIWQQHWMAFAQLWDINRLGKMMSITDSPLCRACMETEETATHVMLQCNGVAEQRAAHLGSSATLHEALGDLGGLLSFWSELDWLE
ncbi:jg14798 [Pararge aegeria aegeria]|uniref:Jg14798 protein n=1 Tax=Pararge aegeria aegeria TaxID=348720 RepID=A0A8S4R7I4_9NEOP|nr:jg14798 [Pararge aegeria aegeria]